jgi:hypothetical protein
LAFSTLFLEGWFFRSQSAIQRKWSHLGAPSYMDRQNRCLDIILAAI